MEYTFRNVNHAFEGLVNIFKGDQRKLEVQDSRNGAVTRLVGPVTFKYKYPRQRVLLYKKRNANPFFHVYEAMWMLAGRNDLKPLQALVKTFGQFSDNGETLNGAYGFRWRKAKAVQQDGTDDPFRCDQLEVLINHLYTFPRSRRAVLQMWNVQDDLLKVHHSADVCCNLCVMFELVHKKCVCGGTGVVDVKKQFERRGDKERPCKVCKGRVDSLGEYPSALNMTVVNRSNDALLGMLGANYVHFSFLQEYVAGLLGVEVGTYCQFTNNLHCYHNDMFKNLSDITAEELTVSYDTDHTPTNRVVSSAQITPLVPALSDSSKWHSAIHNLDYDIEQFCNDPYSNTVYYSPFLNKVAKPMFASYYAWKQGAVEKAYDLALDLTDLDWYQAVLNWYDTRVENAKGKKQA